MDTPVTPTTPTVNEKLTPFEIVLANYEVEALDLQRKVDDLIELVDHKAEIEELMILMITHERNRVVLLKRAERCSDASS